MSSSPFMQQPEINLNIKGKQNNQPNEKPIRRVNKRFWIGH